MRNEHLYRRRTRYNGKNAALLGSLEPNGSDIREGRFYLPSPQTIRHECAKIQRTWSPTERIKRRHLVLAHDGRSEGPVIQENVQWTPPQIDRIQVQRELPE